MTVETAAQAAYIVAALLFIAALAGLSKHETAKVGNRFGISGMAVALVATIVLAIDRDIETSGAILMVIAIVIGAAIGLWRARIVEMTGMPELIALLHSFVGLAAVLVGWNGFLEVEDKPRGAEAQHLDALGTLGIHHAEVVIGIFIGAVTFTGSIIANLKLSAKINSKPLVLPGKNALNLGSLVVLVGAHGLVLRRSRGRPARPRHDRRARPRPAPRRLHRRRRHARRRLHAQQLLRLGRGRLGLPARERRADHHGRARRLLRCLPELHHVQGDEPVVHLRHRRRLRHRGRQRRGDGLRRAPRDQRGGRRRAAQAARSP